MRLPEDARRLLLRKYCNQHREWLVPNDDHWPLIISLEIPTEQAAMRQPEGVRVWIAAWQQWQGAGQLIWSTRHWKILGSQRLPDNLILETPEEVALWIDESARWQQGKQWFTTLITRWPMLTDSLSQHFDNLADYPATDFQRLFDLLSWIEKNPASNLYPLWKHNLRLEQERIDWNYAMQEIIKAFYA